MTKKNKWILSCMTSMLIGMLGVFFSGLGIYMFWAGHYNYSQYIGGFKNEIEGRKF